MAVDRGALSRCDYRILLLAAIGAAVLINQPADAASSCKFENPSKDVAVQGTVRYVDAANSVVASSGYPRVVAINDSQRGCIAHVQTMRAAGCAAGKAASAKGATFVIPFTPVVLLGANSVACR